MEIRSFLLLSIIIITFILLSLAEEHMDSLLYTQLF